MANFWDLPKDVRMMIYRLHLVQDGIMKHDEFVTIANKPAVTTTRYSTKFMPAICHVSRKAETEAAPIFYSENHFELKGAHYYPDILHFRDRTFTRHLRLVRKLSIDWPSHNARDCFLVVAKMSRLEELNIGVDELAMVIEMYGGRHKASGALWLQWKTNGPSPQQQLTILRYPGMTGFLSIKGISILNFTKKRSVINPDRDGGGSLAGGVLETRVRSSVTARHSTDRSVSSSGSTTTGFPFERLPPELRNRVYSLLLHVDGPIHPSKKEPSSAPKGNAKRAKIDQSALSLLAVNRRIHNEAVGVFYHDNCFEFYYPIQLHAFMLSLSTQRQNFLSDIQLHYHDTCTGGVNLADMIFPMLKQLKLLRRLHIIAAGELTNRSRSRRWWSGTVYRVIRANPLQVPGIRSLFSLRGIKDIQVVDTELEDEIKAVRASGKDMISGLSDKDRVSLRLEKIMEFFNSALVDAQLGKVNQKILEDDNWHMKDPFPNMDEEAPASVDEE